MPQGRINTIAYGLDKHKAPAAHPSHIRNTPVGQGFRTDFPVLYLACGGQMPGVLVTTRLANLDSATKAVKNCTQALDQKLNPILAITVQTDFG